MITTSVGQQKRTFDVPINARHWKNSVSLFVCDSCHMVGCYSDVSMIYGLFVLLQLKLKVKSQGLLSNITLAVHLLDLHTLGLLRQQSHNNDEQATRWYGGR